MPSRLTTEAFVLKKKNLPTKDSFITFFSKERGKIVAIAKGIKTITSRRLGAVQTGNLVKVAVYRRNKGQYLQEAHLISAFSGIKKTADKLSTLYLCLFVLDRLLPENEPEPALYDLTKKYYIALSKGTSVDTALLEEFLNDALRKLGYIDEPKSLRELKVQIEEVIGEKLPYFIL